MTIAHTVSVQGQASGDGAGDLVKRVEKDLGESSDTWPVGWPGSSMLTPTAFGGTRGMLGFGLGLQPGIRYHRKQNDGNFGVVAPLGDPVNEIGFDVVGTLNQLHDTVNSGSTDFVVHKRFQDSAVAFGTERLYQWGYTDSDRSYYLVGSHRFSLKESSLEPFSRLTVSLGVGSGRFQREVDATEDKKGVGVFGSAAINLTQQLSFMGEWTGQDMDLGFSLAPIRNLPLVISAAAVDVTGSAGNGARASFGVGYVYRFR